MKQSPCDQAGRPSGWAGWAGCPRLNRGQTAGKPRVDRGLAPQPATAPKTGWRAAVKSFVSAAN